LYYDIGYKRRKVEKDSKTEVEVEVEVERSRSIEAHGDRYCSISLKERVRVRE
jgi:adenylate cyclase class IV